MKINIKKDYMYIVLAAALWGTTGAFMKLLTGEFSAVTSQICVLRNFTTFLIFGVIILIYKPSLFKIKLRDIWVFFGAGILSQAFFTYSYYVSIDYNGMAVAATLLYAAPIFVTLFSAFIFKSKVTPLKFVAIVLSVLGCAFVSGLFSGGETKAITTWGVVAGLCSAIGYALYTIFSKIAMNRGYSGLTVAFYTFAFASIPAFILAIPDGMGEAYSPAGCLIGLAFGFVTGVLPYFFYNMGLKSTDPPLASIISTTEPVVAALIGFIAFKEDFTPFTIVGMVLVLCAVILVATSEKVKFKIKTKPGTKIRYKVNRKLSEKLNQKFKHK